jgi:hypothetical protein
MNYRIDVPASSALWLLVIVMLVPAILAAVILESLKQPVSLSLFLLAAMTVLAILLTAGLWLKGTGTVSIDSHTVAASAATYRFEARRDDVIAASIRMFSSLREAGVGFRRNGIGLPGYRVGWFSMTFDGAPRRAFLLVTRSPLLLVPFATGELLLVSCPSDCSERTLAALGSPRRGEPIEAQAERPR